MPEARRLCTRRPLLTGCKGRGEGGVAGVGGGWTPRYFICHWNWSELGRRNGRLTVVFGHGTETQTMGLTKRSPTGHRRWSRVLWTGLYIVGPLPPYASSGQALRLIDQGWWRVYNGGPVLARQRSKSFFAALFRINYIRLARTTPRAALRFLPTLCERITEYYIPVIEKGRERRGWREEYTPLERKWRGTKMLENVICSEIKGKSIRVLLN